MDGQKSLMIVFFTISLFAPTFCQIPPQPPRFSFGDTTITKDDSLLFRAEIFLPCQMVFDSDYEVGPDSILDSVPPYLIRITAHQRPYCLPAFGYSGPWVLLKNLPVGKYRIVFSDSSDYKRPVPDSVKVRVVERIGSRITPRFSRREPGAISGKTRFHADGRQVKQRPSKEQVIFSRLR